MGHTRALTATATELRIGRFRVAVVDGPDRGAERACDGDELSIGTAPGNALQLTDPSVSRHHCTVRATPDGYQLRDLGSTNGTRLAGHRVELAYLEPGAELRLGATTVRFELGDGELCERLVDDEAWGEVLGASAAMRRIFGLLPRIAASDATILIQGETGTGKSLLARAIHHHSARAAGPLRVLDCSAIPPNLIESELFGHEKGAFTGATGARQGAFEAARGGTVFLDEIGELPLDMQPKLLRALEEREVTPVGGNRTVALDVRVIAATNRDLREAVNRGAFRSDLFFRLHVVELRVPPLRERRDDIPVLAAHFYRQLAPEAGDPPAHLLQQLARGAWPGNVRELRSAVERAVLLGDPQVWDAITGPAPDALPIDPDVPFRVAKELATGRWERDYLRALLARHDDNLSAASREARMDRTYLRELLRRHGLR